jgi:hypothetical protein
MSRSLRTLRINRSQVFDHVIFAVSAVSIVSLLAGCDTTVGPDYGDPGTRIFRTCPGAYTPHSEVCWEANDAGDEDLAANSANSQVSLDGVLGQKRCDVGFIGAPGTEGTLTVSFTTQDIKGLYAPKNCGAVWVEDANESYMRTLALWADERRASVIQWNARACHSDPTITKPDVITSATLLKPATHTATWDGKDFRGKVASDGIVTLWMQFTVNEMVPEGPYVPFPFMKGPEPYTFDGTSRSSLLTLEMLKSQNIEIDGFRGLTITWTPKTASAVTSP